MSEIFDSVVAAIGKSESAFCRYITANDTGRTGSHQAGFFISKACASILFDRPGKKGENLERTVTIKWQDDFETQSHFKYYGVGTRDEYRITNFGRNFPFLQDEFIGSLLVIVRLSYSEYAGYVLVSDEDIDNFYAYFNLSPAKTNNLISKTKAVTDVIDQEIQKFVQNYSDFPESTIIASAARNIYNKIAHVTAEKVIEKPDSVLTSWLNTETGIFNAMENKFYSPYLKQAFSSLDDLIEVGKSILNRRKSRAGKSLEHHLSQIFTDNNLMFEEQVVTEENKKPDFIFPNGKCYHNFKFPADLLISLAAKTTCKDRWRQILNEADRIPQKNLFTLQAGITANQLKEMKAENVQLVVPASIIDSFPREYRSDLLDLKTFIAHVRSKEAYTPRVFLV